MSDLVNEAVTMLNDKLAGEGWSGGTAKFVFKGEGAMMLDATGARAGDEEADVTLTATPETFKALFEGNMNPTAAFMTGRLSVDGNMGLALKLSSVLG
jgi:putative sterol carrier protein